ncbi:MAG: HDIG domain-containing protein [Clostridiales bacterium]|jgi:putative nucleotidyltransferase with HDIG domain|nr:HDIG domain-containing protein [Clostridia bacterium]NLZ47293.1 HDIG domain-containing protein [Clostridiales bacterium]
MKLQKKRKKDKLNAINKISVFILTFIVLFFTLITSLISPKYSLEAGDIAKDDIKAPREVQDKIATEEKYQQVRDSINPQYTKDNEAKSKIIDSVDLLFVTLKDLSGSASDNNFKISQLKSRTNIKLDNELYMKLLDLTDDEQKELQNTLVSAISEVYDKSNIENNNEDLQNAVNDILNKLDKTNLSQKLKAIASSIVQSKNFVKANFFLDEKATEKLENEALKHVDPVIIKKDQLIVKYGEPVTDNQIEVLKELGLLNDNSLIQWRLYLSLGVLIFGVMILQWYYLYRFSKSIYKNNKTLILISGLNCISVILARIIGIASPFLIPFTAVPLLMTLLVNYKVSLVINTLNIILLSCSLGFNVEAIILAIVNTVMGSIVLKKVQNRNNIFYSTIIIIIVNTICILSIGTILSNNFVEVLKRGGFTAVGSITSVVLTIGLLPFFEVTFNIVTVMKLLELANANQPLLRRLLVEAPGTYYHSILVANLAEVAADEVGANSALARVGAYYHDIGKIKRPYFFKENQMGAENPHDKIAANLSALIIISHVKDGVQLAKDYKLPLSIQEIIQQHHGNTLVKYFYITAKNSAENEEDVKEEDFRYAGPIPSSKEAAIIMLADSTEAAVRSMKDRSSEAVKTMVDNIFKDKLNDGQLNGCNLTFLDLEKIKKAFLKTLTGMYHQRIEYPEDKRMLKAEGNKNDIH